MAASATDKFKRVGKPGTATTLDTPGHTSGGTSISVISTNNWETGTGVTFAIDNVTIAGDGSTQVPGSYTVWNGVVTGPTTIGSMVLADDSPNSDQNYAAGSLTRVYVTVSAEHTNNLVDGLLVSHDQDGTLKADAVDATAVIKNAIITNAKLSTTAGELGGAWTTFTPSWSGITIGDGTSAGAYMVIGKTMHIRAYFTLGSTSAITGTISITNPVNMASHVKFTTMGTATYIDDNTGNTYFGPVYHITSSTAVGMQVYNTASTYAVVTAVSSTVPFTWATSDAITVQYTVQLA